MKYLLFRANEKNTNGRIYPEKVVRESIENFEFQQKLKNGEVLGYLGLGQGLNNNLGEPIYKFKDIYFEGSDVYGEIEMLPNSFSEEAFRKVLTDGTFEIALNGVGDFERVGDTNVITSLSITSFDVVSKSSTKRNIYDILHILKVGDEVMTEYGKGTVTSTFGYRGSGYGVKVDVNGIEYTFEKKFR